MIEISLENLGKEYDEATIQAWYFEEGDLVEAGDDLVELLTKDGILTIQSPAAGVLAEVYYDEGELVTKDELLCVVDESQAAKLDEDEDEEDDEEDGDEEEEEKEDEEDGDDEDEDEEEVEKEDEDE